VKTGRKNLRKWKAVRILDGEKSQFDVYACIADKSFKQAVDKDGLLNTRGWVLQERALSRRTIHFTGSQIFWECGSVIHYDNLSQLARPPDLLSSSRFPMTTSGLSEGGARSSFEYIYTNFTNRELSKLKDRQYAVGGLERRLKELYKSEITYGIVHSCLQSSLLWQRSGHRVEDIKDEETKEIPSWSWMKYSGAICYGTIPGFNTRWNRDIKIVQGKERKLIEAPLWRIRPRQKGGMGREGIEITGCRFDNRTINLAEVWHLMGFIVTATHITNHWTEFNPETERCHSESLGFGKISLKGKKPKKLSYALVVISDSPTNKSSKWRRIGVAVIDHEMLSESPEIVKVK